MNKTQAKQLLDKYETIGKLYALAQQGATAFDDGPSHERDDEDCDDDGAFWECANPLGSALLGAQKWQQSVREAWDRATATEGYNNTLDLLGLKPLPRRSFKDFQATAREVSNVQDIPEIAAQRGCGEAMPGRIYLDGLWIERRPKGWWYLITGRHERVSTQLEPLELHLYGYYCVEYD
jgi:hypothetical protein